MTTLTLTCDGATFDEMQAAFTDAMQRIRAGGLRVTVTAAPDHQRPAMLTLTFTCYRHTTEEVLEAMEDASRFIGLGICNGADTGRYHYQIARTRLATGIAGGPP